MTKMNDKHQDISNNKNETKGVRGKIENIALSGEPGPGKIDKVKEAAKEANIPYNEIR